MTSCAVRIALLGPPRVVAWDGSREFTLPRKTLNVLAYLILKSKRPLTRDSVAYALFPDEDEAQARNSLRRNLSYLLSSLPPAGADEPFIHTGAEWISWNPGAPAHVDVFAFERAIADGRDDDALAEYGGTLLPTLYDEWTTADRERLRDTANEALARTIARDRSQRRFDAATAAARRLLEDDPWREDIVRQLMSIRYDAGDRAGALAAFAEFAAHMHAHMDAEPMTETIALRDVILRGGRLATSEPTARTRAPNDGALPFVGRDEAMTRAIERWHVSADGRAGALFVAGQAGIGKSRFVAELARAIEREGGTTIVGETAAGGERRPYEAVIEALRNAPALRSDDATRLDQLLDEHSQATLSDDRAARIRLFDTVHTAVRQLARARPLAIVLEDLHWAGPATVDLIGYLIERLATASVFVIVTYRDDELPRTHPLRTLIPGAGGSERAVPLTLSRINASDAVRAVTGAAPSHLTDEALATAVAWSDGIPLLLAESVRDIAAGRAFSGADFSGVIDERLARLPPEAETALNFGAVLGARFELDTLAAATGWRDDELVDALAPSMELGLIRAGPRSRGLAFAFSHHLIHAATLARIAAPDQVRTHAFVARALSTLFSGGDRGVEIAQHFAQAGDARHAAEHYAAGARYALDVFANVDAREAATAGLAFATEADSELRYRLIATREAALARLGLPIERRADAVLLCELAAHDDERACDALRRLIEGLRNDKPAQLDALARLQLLARRSERAAAIYEQSAATEADAYGDFREAAAAAERAAERFEALGDQLAALRSQLLIVNAEFRLGDHARAAEIIAELRPTAERCNDLSLQIEFYVFASGSEHLRLDVSLADAERALALAILIGDRFAEAKTRHNVGWAAANSGQVARSIDEYERAIAVYADIGNLPGAAMTFANLAALRGWCGDYAGAFGLIDKLEALELDEPYVTLQCQVHRGSLYVRAGDLTAARHHFTLARERARDMGHNVYGAHIGAFFAEIEARSRRFSQACAELDAAQSALEPLEMPLSVAKLHAVRARVCAEMEAMPDARAALDAAAALVREAPSLEVPNDIWWDLVAASMLLDDAAGATEFARCGARVFAEQALLMGPDLAEMSGTLPWHVATFAFLAGREVTFTLGG